MDLIVTKRKYTNSSGNVFSLATILGRIYVTEPPGGHPCARGLLAWGAVHQEEGQAAMLARGRGGQHCGAIRGCPQHQGASWGGGPGLEVEARGYVPLLPVASPSVGPASVTGPVPSLGTAGKRGPGPAVRRNRKGQNKGQHFTKAKKAALDVQEKGGSPGARQV